MTLPIVFFDLDDTLVDHAGAEAAAQGETFAAHAGAFGGLPLGAWLDVYREANARLWAAYGRGEISRGELQVKRFAEALSSLGLDPSSASALGDFYLARYRESWRLNEGAEEALAETSRRAVVGILSNGFSELIRAKVAVFRLDRWVRHVVASEEVGVMKPARGMFDAALRAAAPEGEDGQRKVYVGDSFENDVVGAKAAGWLPILYNPRRLPLPAPVLYVARLADVAPLVF